MTRPHGDHRSWLTAPLQGGPPWTTKVRLVAFVSVVVIFSPILIVVGAIMEGVEFATKLFGRCATRSGRHGRRAIGRRCGGFFLKSRRRPPTATRGRGSDDRRHLQGGRPHHSPHGLRGDHLGRDSRGRLVRGLGSRSARIMTPTTTEEQERRRVRDTAFFVVGLLTFPAVVTLLVCVLSK